MRFGLLCPKCRLPKELQVLVYEKLHVRRVVNASANNSRLGGCLVAPEVLDAMAEASKWFVDMDELHRQAGRFIAELTGAEDAQVTSGAAGALLLGTAACITNNDRAKMLKLPENVDAEVILPKGQLTGFHQAIKTTGAKIVEVGLPYRVSTEELEAAIGDKTVALCYTFGEGTSKVGMVSLPDMISIGKRFRVPVLVDAAVASYPPSRLREYIALGADLVAFSSPKHINGPPATGFICGRADLIEACRRQAGPAYGIGRPLKVSKEEIVGLVKALELYVNRDILAEQAKWESQVAKLIELLSDLPHLQVSCTFPDEVGRPVPRVRVQVDAEGLGITARQLAERLRKHDPPVVTQEFLLDVGTILLNPIGLLAGDDGIIHKAFVTIWSSLGLV